MKQDPEVAAILSRPPDPARPYLYPGTNVRVNKFGILNPYALDLVSRATSNLRATMLQSQPIQGDFDLRHLCAVHHFLFQDVYPWAGDIRIVDFDRSEEPFTKPEEILPDCTEVFAQLNSENQLRTLDHDQFTNRLTYYIHCFYRIHPFRDGNGRTLRAFFRQLASERGFHFDLSSIPQSERHATARAAHCGNMAPLTDLIRRVTSSIGGRRGA